jgi:aerobic carbon-monoxide dehydrogenase medium subunit
VGGVRSQQGVGLKPPCFDYVAPRTLDETLGLLDSPDAEVLAGGQSLMPLLNFRERSPAVLVDINGVPGLDRAERHGDTIEIGALVRHSQLGRLEAVRTHCPVLLDAARHIGHTPIRNRGTFGGSIAHCHPAAELAAVAVVADAEVELVSRSGTRTVSFDSFAVDAFTTTRRQGEVIRAVRLRSLEGLACGFHEITRRTREYALAGAVTAIEASGGIIRSARVAVFAAGPLPRRLPDVEEALAGASLERLDFAALSRLTVATTDVDDRDQLRRDYRRHLAGVAVTNATRQALARVPGP